MIVAAGLFYSYASGKRNLFSYDKKIICFRNMPSFGDMYLMLGKRVAFVLFGLSATLLLAVALLPVHAASALVQQNNRECLGCSSTLSVSFTNNVASGDVIVVGVVVGEASFTLSSLTDALGSTFTQAVTSTNAPPPIVYIYYATLAVSGEEIVTATFSGAAPAETVYIYEVSGVTTARVANATGSGTGTSISTSTSVSFQNGSFLLGIIGTNSFGATATPGAGFTLSTNNSGTGVAYAQYSISGVSSPTSFQATTNSAVSWAEDAIALTLD